MRKIICFGIVFLTLVSCKSAFVSTAERVQSNAAILNTDDSVNEVGNRPYFEASGTEPFWTLSISGQQIVYRSLTDSIVTAAVEPILAMDANVKMYQLKTEFGSVRIQVSQQGCINLMSGKSSPYAVTVAFQKKGASAFEKVTGCGHYVTDYRLHDIWVLEELNGRKMSRENFCKKLPVLEIYASSNTFLGFSGCHQIKGDLFFEKGKLRLIPVKNGLIVGEKTSSEAEFIAAIQSVNHYTIENNSLVLSNSSGIKVVLKKID